MSLKMQKNKNKKIKSLEQFKHSLREISSAELGTMKWHGGGPEWGGYTKEQKLAIHAEIARRKKEHADSNIDALCRDSFGKDFKYVASHPVTHRESHFGDKSFELEQVWRDLGQAMSHVASLKAEGREVAVTAYVDNDGSASYNVFATKAPDKMLKKSKRTSVTVDGFTLKKGDVFSTSWGYDQTNYNFIVITGFTESGKTAICRMSKATRVDEESGRGYDALRPTGEPYGDEFKMKVDIDTNYRGEKTLHLTGSYPFTSGGEMRRGKRLDSFRKVSKDDIHHQTALGWGH